MFSILFYLAPQLSQKAYLDPGSGSFLLQIILAALLGGAFAIRMYWKKLSGWFKKQKGKNTTPTENDKQNL